MLFTSFHSYQYVETWEVHISANPKDGSKLPTIIQGGMGVGVSGWRLARAVSQLGEMGVVSGTGLNSVMVRRLQMGDPGGHVRRALEVFFDQRISDKILDSYFNPDATSEHPHFKRLTLPSIKVPLSAQRVSVAAGFVEVWLAKQGHDGVVGINFLEKLQTSNLPVLYGAMLAGVDVVLIGAGLPKEIPGVLDNFSQHQPATISVTATGSTDAVKYATTLSPLAISSLAGTQPIFRPKFYPIVSSSTLAHHLMHKSTGVVDGFVVEGMKAGGHNAPPRGVLTLSANGEPVYAERDFANVQEIRNLGLPFWLAGSYGSADKLVEALELGATGIQVGTAFAFCNESGLTSKLKDQVIRQWITNKELTGEAIFTDPQASPTGFPFKVVELPGTLSDGNVYAQRPRKCDIGYLRQMVVQADGSVVYRCPAEPIEDYIKKGGALEDTINRKCLCNALISNIGLAQTQEDGYLEPALLTAGDDLVNLGQFLKPGFASYSAKDVIQRLYDEKYDFSKATT